MGVLRLKPEAGRGDDDPVELRRAPVAEVHLVPPGDPPRTIGQTTGDLDG
jgi:hypothetical protein